MMRHVKKSENENNKIVKALEKKINVLASNLEREQKKLKSHRLKEKVARDKILRKETTNSLHIQKLKRLHAFINHINKKILRVDSQETLFRNACEIALKFGKFEVAWVGLFENDFSKINIVEHSGIGAEDFLQFKTASVRMDSPERYVLKNKRAYICNDIADTLELGNWKKYAVKHGILSAIVIPIKKAGQITGTFNLYSRDVKFAAREEIDLIVDLVKDISFALDLLDKIKVSKEIEEVVTLNENRFRTIAENGQDLVILAKKSGEFIFVSPNALKFFGQAIEENKNQTWSDFIYSEDLVGFLEARNKIQRNVGMTLRIEIRLKDKIANYIWHECRMSNFLNKHGIIEILLNFKNISELKTLIALKAFNKKNYNALIDCTSDLIWSVDKNFNLISSNRAFNEIQKINTGKVILKGRHALSSEIPPQELIRYKRFYERAFAGEIFTEREYTAFPKETWSEISFYPIWEGDKVIATACSLRDISERKKGGEQLKKSERFNKGILDSLSAHIAVVDFEGTIVSVNESWKRFGKENGSSHLMGTNEGSNYFDVCEYSAKNGITDAAEALQGMKDVINQKRDVFYMEYPCDSPLKRRWFALTVRKFDNDEALIVASHQDISQRKLAEQEHLKSEASLKEAQAMSHTGNWELDFETNVHTWSEELYRIFGIKERKLPPSTEYFLSFMHPDDLRDIKIKVEEAFKNLEATSYAFRFVRRDGEVRYGYTERKFEFDENKKPKRLLGVVQDITERKLADLEREKMVQNIIQQSKDKEQFAYIISHNLRAPIAHIMGLANLLKESLSEEDVDKIHQYIFSSVVKLEEVINDLNKILQVKSEITEHREVDYFDAIVNDIKFSIGDLLENENVEIITDFLAMSKLNTLKGYLHSIFFNLISNSIKYKQRDRRVVITIKTKRTKDTVKIIFKDNGMGMDLKQYGDKIFGLYKRFHPHIEGKGFGLFMVKTQVEFLGGKISLTSELNEGAEFTIEFPLDLKTR